MLASSGGYRGRDLGEAQREGRDMGEGHGGETWGRGKRRGDGGGAQGEMTHGEEGKKCVYACIYVYWCMCEIQTR